MNTILLIGVIVVVLALLFYSVAIFFEQRLKRINKKILIFLSLGLFFDFSATVCMIIGSSNSAFTFHGFIGYTALLAMSIETYLAYTFFFKYRDQKQVSKPLHLYARYAYILWLVVFITGGMLVAMNK